MPIYAYRCDDCGFSKDVLQKISDPVLTDCLSCGKPAFKKQVTAAGFQLKGSGWYVTDFRGGKAPAGAPAGAPSVNGAAPVAGSAGAGEAPASSAAAATPAAAPAAASPGAAPAAAPAGGDKSGS